MKDYTSYTDLGAANIDNPSGVIKDGETTGTLLNKVSWNDLFQFVFKCVRNTDITPNDLFDSVTNEYQLFKAILCEDWKEIDNDGGATTLVNGWAQGSGAQGKMKYRRINGGSQLQIKGALSASTASASTAFTLPSGFIPQQEVYIVSANLDVSGFEKIQILSSGEVKFVDMTIPNVFEWGINIIIPLD